MKTTFDFTEFSYKFLQSDYPCNHFTLEQLRSASTGKLNYELSQAQNTFCNQKNALQNDFRKILKFWKIDLFKKDLMKNEQYIFCEDDLEFLLKLLHKYRTHPVWKREIRKMSSVDDLCKQLIFMSNPESLLEEIKFTSEGFIHLYERRNLPNNKKIAFRIHIELMIRYSELNRTVQLKNNIAELLQSYCVSYAANQRTATDIETYINFMSHLNVSVG